MSTIRPWTQTRPQDTRTLDRGTSWDELAACEGEDTNLWFPEGRATEKDWAAPRAICDRCPVQAECLRDALDGEGTTASTWGRYGMRGGLTPKERGQLFGAVADPEPEPKPVSPPRCGTVRGARQHRDDGTPLCGPCTDAAERAARLAREAADRRRNDPGIRLAAAAATAALACITPEPDHVQAQRRTQLEASVA